jgi:hypothetical protein
VRSAARESDVRAALGEVVDPADRVSYRGRQLYLWRFDTEDRIDSVAVYFESSEQAGRFAADMSFRDNGSIHCEGRP